ncbi:hypothetical protein [Neolewinella persica]|uniref:hypothetical protein n=1 Tax=Neolewinella persica TaxID=70998 RepID=UPI000370F9E8|nr:hypothetical protein [Neolewinella persica]
MPIRNLARRFSPWLTIYLLVVSIGLPLQRVYCLCKGEQWLSISMQDHECEHEEAPKALVAEVKSACCLATDACQSIEDKHGCGNEETIVAQLDVDFVHELSDWNVDGTTLVALPGAPYWQQLPEVERVSIMLIRGPDPPPRYGGRELLVAHQTFLI